MNKNYLEFLEGIEPSHILDFHRQVELTANSARAAMEQLEMHEKQIQAIRRAMYVPKLTIPRVPKIDLDMIPKIDFGAVPKIQIGPLPKIDLGTISKIDLGTIPKIDFGKISMDKIHMPKPQDILASRKTVTQEIVLRADILDTNDATGEIKVELDAQGKATSTIHIYGEIQEGPAPKLIIPPGKWMIAIASLFPRRARELILEPNLADYRTEYFAALVAGKPVARIHLAYSVAFLYDLLMALVDSFRKIRKSAD